MKSIQLNPEFENDTEVARELLRMAGVKRIHRGWFTVFYRGPICDRSTVCSASHNPRGDIKE